LFLNVDSSNSSDFHSFSRTSKVVALINWRKEKRLSSHGHSETLGS